MATSSSVSDLMINVKPRVLNGGDRICLGVIQIAIVVKSAFLDVNPKPTDRGVVQFQRIMPC